MIGGIDENRLRDTKVRTKPGATVEDMFFQITPYLRKKPSHIICHVGTNNTTDDTSDMVIQKLGQLRDYIKFKLPNCQLFFSAPIIRRDNQRSAKVVAEVIQKMHHLETPFISNNNIGEEGLGKKGLHMNYRGTTKLAVNFIDILKELNT